MHLVDLEAVHEGRTEGGNDKEVAADIHFIGIVGAGAAILETLKIASRHRPKLIIAQQSQKYALTAPKTRPAISHK